MMTSTAYHHPSVAAQISHELRIPITGILGTAQFLNQTLLNTQQKQYLQTIQAIVGRLLGLEDQLYIALKMHKKISFPTNGVVKIAHSLEQTPLNDEQKQYLHIMLISANRLNGLKQKLFAFIKANEAFSA